MEDGERDAGPVEIGPHRIMQGDIERGDLGRLVGGDVVDVVYSDPPWGQGNLRYWRTHADDATVPVWENFRARWVADVARVLSRSGAMFVEMGIRWADEWAAALAGAGWPVRASWTTMYSGGSKLLPNRLLYAGPPLPSGFDPSALRDQYLPRACVGAALEATGLVGSKRSPRALVLDPCCGKGFTARAAVHHGLAFRGMELNPKRLAVTEGWLRKHAAALGGPA